LLQKADILICYQQASGASEGEPSQTSFELLLSSFPERTRDSAIQSEREFRQFLRQTRGSLIEMETQIEITGDLLCLCREALGGLMSAPEKSAIFFTA
jgi:hypothetical protein